ncbi:receptor-like protein kinase FERONIA [Vigna umbellata]|uniref:receptor-like protein kinase FERONIA n=1 Tax=Vigna umbellata TaxID=87088 RepID=UPI001F5EDA55|nr:receptor-like protein kinase FERONIA [Vigna umbellata]
MFLKCFGESSSSGRQYPTVIEELCRHFSLADIQKSTNNFDHKRLIARGWVKVYKGCLQHIDGSDYAVTVRRFNVEDIEMFKREVELLCQLHHPNCVSIVGFCNHKKEKITVHEYNRSLLYYLLDEVRETLPWKKRIEICIGAARGLHYLHAGLKRTIIHRSINSASILLDDNMHPKLSSFGLSIMGAHFKEKSKPIQTDLVGNCSLSMLLYRNTLMRFSDSKELFDRLNYQIWPVKMEAHLDVNDIKRDKYDKKEKVGIFEGYNSTSKAYRIFLPHCNKIIVSRDVQFFEEEKWGKENEKKSLQVQEESVG